MGYHQREIKKGVLGQASKVREELDEFEDALDQGIRIMALVELSDIYGALEALADAQGTSMEELRKMAEVTARAFQDGTRVSRILREDKPLWGSVMGADDDDPI